MDDRMILPRTKIKAVIFDLDGTLVDSEPNYFESDRRLLAEYGIQDFDAELKSKYIGIGSRAMLEDIMKNYQINESIENLLVKKNQYYLEIARQNTVVFAEMKKFLHGVKERGYAMALASGSSPEVIEVILEVTELKPYFEVILSAEDVKKGKPAPDIFLEAAKRLGISPESCLVIEDSQYGVEAAKSAAMYCIALPYLPEFATHESYRRADLLFAKGISEFISEEVFAWVENRNL